MSSDDYTVELYDMRGRFVTSVPTDRALAGSPGNPDSDSLTYRFENVAAGQYKIALVSQEGQTISWLRVSGQISRGVVTMPTGGGWEVAGQNLTSDISGRGKMVGDLNVPSTWKSSTVCVVAVTSSGKAVSSDCGPKGAPFVLDRLSNTAYKFAFTNGSVTTAAQFKAFTGSIRWFGNTTSSTSAPLFSSSGVSTQYLPVWFYKDVTYKTSKFTAVQWMGDEGIFTGYSDGTFRPASTLTRQAFVTYLYKLAGSPPVTLPSTSPFKDVSKSTSSTYKAIVWAQQKKIISGTYFKPTSAVTRSSAAVMLYKNAGSPKVTLPSKSPYKDVKKSTSSTYKAIIWAKNKKIIGAASGSYYKPSSTVVRSSGAAYLYNYWWYVG